MAIAARKYWTTKLFTADGTSRYPSLPLVIPNDCNYNPATNELVPIPEAKRDKLIIVPEALELLQAIRKPLAILSITGPYRSGKSYVLSRLLGESNVFDLGHTMDAKTFGIWMATSVLECDYHAIILLDTEGIDAATSSGQEDTRIFVLTLLLSSFFIYNSKGVVNKSDLDRMSFFVKLASSITIKKGSSKSSIHELRKHFPDFLWLLRDATLQSTDENGLAISPREFLKTRILVQGDDSFEETVSDKVGRAIITFFPTIDCITLPPPSTDTDVMKQIYENTDKLNPEFNKQINDLVEHLKQNVLTKKIFESGEAVTGPFFARLTQQFIEAINDPNNTPVLANTWESTIKIFVSDVQEKLKQEYIQEFTEAVKEASTNDDPLEEGDSSGEGQSTMTTIFGIHHALMVDKNAKLLNEVGQFCVTGATVGSELTQEQALADFRKSIIEVKKSLVQDQEHKSTTKDVVIGGVLFSFVQENYRRSRKYCCKVFNDLYKAIKDKILGPSDTYTFSNLRADLQKLNEHYLLQAIGPAKWDVYDEKEKVLETDQVVFQRLEGYEKKLMKADQEIADSIRRNQQMSEDIYQLRQQVQDEAAEHQQNINEMERQHSEVIERLKNEMKRRDELEERKYHEFMETQREIFAKNLAKSDERAKKNDEVIQQLIKQQKDQTAMMQNMLEKRSPPPPPRPIPREEMCCIL